MSKELLTKKKRQWAKGRNVNLRGTRLSYNVSSQLKYQKVLLGIIRMMTDEVKEDLVKLFKGDTSQEFFEQQEEAAAIDASITNDAKKLINDLMKKFDRLFSLRSRKLAEKMVRDQDQASKSSLHVSLKQLSGGLSLKTGVVPKGMEAVSQAIIEENVSLIKLIPAKYFKDITGSVMRSITTGQGLKTLLPQIEKYNRHSEKQAKNLALDQTRKAYNAINKQRMQKVGVKKFEWVHSGGGQKPRQSHIAMSGNIYSFDNLPVINKEQVDRGYESPERGIPGQAINCRCIMVPIIEFDDEE